MGYYEYEPVDNTKSKSAFNIYQAFNGAIKLVMGNNETTLTYSQIKDLGIYCYGLRDFDHDNFQNYYQSENWDDVLKFNEWATKEHVIGFIKQNFKPIRK